MDAAQNNIAAFLARARTEAIGLQETRGLMFFIDPKTPERVSIALVHETAGKGLTTDTPAGPDLPNVDKYLDLVPDSDFLQLPKNVGVQVIDDAGPTNAPNDRYIGFNTFGGGGTTIKYGGVILFDGNGLLHSESYGFRCSTGAAASGPARPMGVLLFNRDPSSPGNAMDFVPGSTSGILLRSQFGLVVFDQEAFANNGDLKDPQVEGTAYSAAESAEEGWLDREGTAVLINRYNGTLVKGE